MPATGRRQGDGAAGWARQPHRVTGGWSGGVFQASPAPGPLGSQHGQPARQRRRSNQHGQRNDEPAGLSAWLGGHWGRCLGRCSGGDGEALSGLHPLEGGVRGGLLRRGDLVVAPGLPDLAFAGRPPLLRRLVNRGVGEPLSPWRPPQVRQPRRWPTTSGAWSPVASGARLASDRGGPASLALRGRE